MEIKTENLPPEERQRLEALAADSGRSPGEVALDLLSEALSGARVDRSTAVMGSTGDDQVRALEELMREADSMGTATARCRLSGSTDHDEILYGGDDGQ